ncbi:hypothetical protein BCV69DRAFT_617 [Microstroma glucosiphilum]|uniref:Uncharacterized protein n=1 Tax=Pseudomicrostroma glucosiphilum TaxID=1684307 RepID=A0A316UF07_9BASI|nr:hypothetical protein BCV69DRAFT_617 [Pseudomicrostroma glucosiphilum]PWN23494.1 hypothetical protein BCV69DRAFT_617 [Pseudomicrostroma glucosiphilum]
MKIAFWLAILLLEFSARVWALPNDVSSLDPRFKVNVGSHPSAGQPVRVGSVTLNLTPLEIPTTSGLDSLHGSPSRPRRNAGSFSATWSRPREHPSSQRLARDDDLSSLSSGSPSSPSPRRGAGRSPATPHRNPVFDRHHSPSPARGARPWAYFANGSSPQRGPNSPARRYRPLSESDIFLPVPPARSVSSSPAPEAKKKGAWARLKGALRGCASCARPQ